jgi:hypothetical protein
LSDANPLFTDSYGPVVLNNDTLPTVTVVNKTIAGGASFEIPSKCDSFGITSSAAKADVNLTFNTTESYYTKISVVASSGYVRLNLKKNSDGVVQHSIIMAVSGVIGVRNANGSLYVDGGEVEADYTCDFDNGQWFADCTNHFANKVDFTRMSFITGHRYGSYSTGGDAKNDLFIKIPLKDADDGDFEIYLTNYASNTYSSSRVLRIYFTSADDTSVTVTSEIDIEASIFINGGRYVFRKSGNSITRIG